MDEIQPMISQPIPYFFRLELRRLQYLSENFLTHKELNVVLELVALADFWNIIQPRIPLSRYMQERFRTDKRNMNRYLKNISDLKLYLPIESRSNAFRGMPFLFNRQKKLPGFWEFDGVDKTPEYVFGEGFQIWSTEGDGSKILSADSYVRTTKSRRKARPTIDQAEHDKIVSDLKRKHTEEITMLQKAFTEVVEEENRKFAERQAEYDRKQAEHDRKFSETLEMFKHVKDTIMDAIGELKKHDTDAAEKLERRHKVMMSQRSAISLRLIKDDQG